MVQHQTGEPKQKLFTNILDTKNQPCRFTQPNARLKASPIVFRLCGHIAPGVLPHTAADLVCRHCTRTLGPCSPLTPLGPDHIHLLHTQELAGRVWRAHGWARQNGYTRMAGDKGADVRASVHSRYGSTRVRPGQVARPRTCIVVCERLGTVQWVSYQHLKALLFTIIRF